MNSFTVTVESGGARADAFFAELDEIGSRSEAQRLIAEGRITLDGAPIKKNRTVQAGEEYSLELPEPESSELLAQNIPLDVCYEDSDVIVVNKPKGMVVHPAPGHSDSTLVNALLYHCGESLSGIGGVQRPGIVHRIDKDTSGLIIAAKNDEAHRSLSAQLKDRSLSRTYEALVCGVMKANEGEIDLPIGRSPSDRKKMAINAPHARDAVTYWETVERFKDITHVRCRLKTGRTHQIRVHMAALARPILGDGVYGGKAALKYGQQTQCLHARELKFIHPRTGEQITVSCELPDYFKELLAKLEKIV